MVAEKILPENSFKPWDFGPLSMKSILRYVISADDYTKQQIFSTLCPKHHCPKLKRPYMKYGRQRQK